MPPSSIPSSDSEPNWAQRLAPRCPPSSIPSSCFQSRIAGGSNVSLLDVLPLSIPSSCFQSRTGAQRLAPRCPLASIPSSCFQSRTGAQRLAPRCPLASIPSSCFQSRRAYVSLLDVLSLPSLHLVSRAELGLDIPLPSFDDVDALSVTKRQIRCREQTYCHYQSLVLLLVARRPQRGRRERR